MLKVLVRFKADNRNLQLYYVDPETGREVSKSAGTKNQREAERAAFEWEKELTEHRGTDGTGWDHFRERFSDEHLAGMSKHGRKAFRTALNHFERIINVAALSDVTASTMSIFKKKLLEERRPATTVANYLTHVRTALLWAEAIGMIRRAPKVRRPKMSKRRLARSRPVTLAECERMKDACGKLANPFQWRRFLDLLWYSGLRLNEALKLSWDSAPMRLDLYAKPYPLIIYHAEGQKSGEDEAVPIPPDFAAWLDKTPVEHRRGLVAPLRRFNGNLYDSDKAGRIISELGYSAGVSVNDKSKYASAHDFRRAFGTRWAQKVRPMVLQRMMRHKMIETTLCYYVGLENVDIGAELWHTVPTTVPKISKKAAAG